MNIIKGFVSIESYINNQPGQTAVLGELSSWSRTYSKEKGEYNHTDVPGYSLTSFKSIDNSTGTPVIVSTDQTKEILSVIRECVAYGNSHMRPYSTSDFINTIQVAFYQRISDLKVGNFVDNGQIALPEWLTWTSLQSGNNQVKVWLADMAFQNQYEEYSIVVVPPLDNLDNFFRSYQLVVNDLRALTLPDFTDKIQVAKGVYPETYTRVFNFDFYNTLDLSQKYTTNWGVLVYGIQGDNVDNIKDAIVAYILANSSFSRTQWESILPDLFKNNEFVILPRWDLISIPNQTSLSSLYKSMMNPKECLAFAKSVATYYLASFVDDNTLVMPYSYKTLSLVAINGSSNIPSLAKLDALFPDYLPLPSTSMDFTRMSTNTRGWVLFLEELLIQAETANEFSTVPLNMRKQTRNGNLYISAMYNNVNYLVAARSNTAIYPNIGA